MGLYENLRSEKVSRLALRDPVVVHEDATVRDAIEVMRQRKLGCAIIVDANQKPQGLFSESQLTSLLSKDPATVNEPIAILVKKGWPGVRISEPICRVLEVLESHNVRFLIVDDEQGKLVGLTGQKGLMEYVAEHFPGQVIVQRIGGNPYPIEREGA